MVVVVGAMVVVAGTTVVGAMVVVVAGAVVTDAAGTTVSTLDVSVVSESVSPHATTASNDNPRSIPRAFMVFPSPCVQHDEDRCLHAVIGSDARTGFLVVPDRAALRSAYRLCR